MARGREDRTYRVRQISAYLDRYNVALLLAGLDESLGPLDNIHVHSLAASLNPSEDTPTRTATVMFVRVPTIFDNDNQEWVIKTRHHGLQKDVIFDIHFLGFTALNSVEPSMHSFE
jgi:hypothetical protein